MGRGRPKSAYTLDKEAFAEYKEKGIKEYQDTELAGTKAHRSKGADKTTKTLLSGNLGDKDELNFLFKEFKDKGLIPEFITPSHAKGKKIYLKDPASLINYLNERTRAAYLRGDFGTKIKGKDPANQFKIGILNDIIRREALSKVPEANRTAEVLEDINKMSWKGLPLKISETGEVSFNRRQFADKVPQAVIDWANSNPQFGENAGTRWAKEARKGWDDLLAQNQRYQELTGFEFDRGHFYPSKFGGPNTIRNASSEIAWNIGSTLKNIPGNRDKKELFNFKGSDVGRELGTSNSWVQDFVEWHLDEKGLNANQLPKDYWVDNPGHALIQQKQTLEDQVKAAQSTVANKYEEFKAKQQIIPEGGQLQPDLEIVNGKVVKKITQPSKSQEILQVIRNGNGNGNGNGIKNGKQIFESVIGGKVVKETIDATSKVLGKIPKPVRRLGAALPVIGAVSDGSAIAGAVFDQNESVEQQKINDMQAISGGLGLTGFVFPPAWIPSTMMWGIAEIKQWQLNRKEQKAKDLELWYMTKSVQPKDEKGNLVTPEWGSGQKTWQDRLNARRGVR